LTRWLTCLYLPYISIWDRVNGEINDLTDIGIGEENQSKILPAKSFKTPQEEEFEEINFMKAESGKFIDVRPLCPG
jgi:hypothetical protein